MDNKNLMPQQAKPIERITTGQFPESLAVGEALQFPGVDGDERVLASGISLRKCGHVLCIPSYDGDDAE